MATAPEHHQHKAERQLCDLYQEWCDAEGLPAMSADELQCEELTDRQQRWVDAFVALWDANDPHVAENIVQIERS